MLLLWLAACTPTTDDPPDIEPPSAPNVLWSDAPSAFFDAPFPSDLRTRDGIADYRNFPNPDELALLDAYVSTGTRYPGFGPNHPVLLPFSEVPDLDQLPGDASGFASADSPVVLLNLESGDLVPLAWTWFEDGGKYHPDNLLSVAPFPGQALAPSTPHAVLLHSDFALGPESFQAAFAESEHFAAARAQLPELGWAVEDVGLATVWTTSDPTWEMTAIADFIDSEPAGELSQAVDLLDVQERYRVFEGFYQGPLFMHGEKPYAASGGELRFRDGEPLVSEWESQRFALSVPNGEPPDGGWPVVIYQHGTGGSYRSPNNSDDSKEPAVQWASAGVAGFAIELPLHGLRGTPDTLEELHTFNLVQPDSGINTMRQGAADALWVAKALADGPSFRRPNGEIVRINPERIAFMGHSQGGISGAIAAPWMGRYTSGLMLSGAGGLLAIAAVERKDILDFEVVIRGLLQMDEDTELSQLHPVLGAVQGFADPTDPVNYAGGWFDGRFDSPSVPILLTSGVDDEQTPRETAEALAAAAGLPVLKRRADVDSPALDVAGVPTVPLPQRDNVTAADGPVTAGFLEVDEADHFVVFTHQWVSDLSADFLISSVYGDALLTEN